MNKEFEMLPAIAEVLEDNIWYFCKTNNQYFCDNLYMESGLNLAWYAYQEQQKKIDDLEDRLEIMQAGEDY